MTSDWTHDNSLKFCKGRYRLDIRKNFFMESGVRHWNRLYREVVTSISLEIFKTSMNVVLRTMV